MTWCPHRPEQFSHTTDHPKHIRETRSPAGDIQGWTLMHTPHLLPLQFPRITCQVSRRQTSQACRKIRTRTQRTQLALRPLSGGCCPLPTEPDHDNPRNPSSVGAKVKLGITTKTTSRGRGNPNFIRTFIKKPPSLALDRRRPPNVKFFASGSC